MKIEKISKTKSGKYILEFDNNEKIKTYDEVILNNNLLYKKEISSELLNEIEKDNIYYDVYNKVLKFISAKMRSEEEINKYLDKLEVLNKEKIICKLKDVKLINDNAFLKAYVYDKFNLTLNGPEKIKKELLEHNIDENLINEELNKYNNLLVERINKLINKKMKVNKKSTYLFKQKIVNDLIDLGYSKDMIVEELNKYNIDESNNIKKDYGVLYKKLSKKYKDNELKYQIKNKLFSKGYSIDNINEVIE